MLRVLPNITLYIAFVSTAFTYAGGASFSAATPLPANRITISANILRPYVAMMLRKIL